ncbi:hypothetical protein KKE99_00635 [Patescibacteria group bacterium]|nr:hypothetical protein [Patescibacteria group bacterium]
MNSEKENLEYNSKIENERAESKELSFEEKKQLVEVWGKIVLGKADSLQDIDAMTSEDIKKWLFNSLMQEIDSLAKEWGIESDKDLTRKIQEEQNLENKAKLEAEHIKEMHDKVSGIAENFDMASADVHWSSWPGRMKETKQFNCVGATLLGINFLNKAGIKSYYGMPAGHVANVARLSNGEWQYADFLVQKLVKKINPSETRLGNTEVLKIDDEDIGFRVVPLLKNSEAPSSILDNLSELKEEEINQNMPKETVDYISKFQGQFSRVDFSDLSKKLYPDARALEETKEMKEEVERKK